MTENNYYNMNFYNGPNQNQNPNSNPNTNVNNDNNYINFDISEPFQPKEEQVEQVDEEKDIEKNIQSKMRLGFIRKVYGILSVQLLITVLVTVLACVSTSFATFLATNSILYWLSLIILLVFPILIICGRDLMRKVPMNYIILFIFTLAESYFVAAICASTNKSIVLMAAIMTCAMVLSITLYALLTKTDFTTKGGILCVCGCGLLLLTIFGIFTRNKFYHIVLCVLGIILFGFYLLYDTQLVIGKKKDLIEMDDYIFGAFTLYTDIIALFLKLLELLRLTTQ